MRLMVLPLLLPGALALASCGGGSYDTATTIVRAPYEVGGEARNNERFAWFVPNQIETTASRPVSAFSLDVDTTGYAVARGYVRDKQLPPARSVRSAEFLNYFDYGYPAPAAGQHPFRLTAVIAPNPWNPDTKLLHVGIKARSVARDAMPPLRLVVALDTAETMAPPDRLPLIKAALADLAASLTDRDRVALVAFGDQATLLLPPTSGADTAPLREAVAKLSPKGKSMGAAGIELAYRTATSVFEAGAVNLVVLMSSGELDDLWANQRRGLPAIVEQVRQHRDGGIGLKVLGVGSQSLNASVLRELSTAGRGKASYADSAEEASRFFRTELGDRRLIVAHEALANVELNPAHVVEYRLIGYENNQSSSWEQRRAAYPGSDIGAGQEVTILYEITPPDSPARRVLPLRYSRSTSSELNPSYAGEVAYLRIGYRLPGTTRRQSMTQVVSPADERSDIALVPSSTRLAIAVAAYAEKLRNDGYIGDDFTFSQVRDLAQSADGPDPSLLRRQLLELVGQAGILSCAASRQLSADCRR